MVYACVCVLKIYLIFLFEDRHVARIVSRIQRNIWILAVHDIVDSGGL